MNNDESLSFRLLTADDVSAISLVMEDDAGFSRRINGRPFVSADLDDFFEAVPPSISLNQKYSVGIFASGRLVGLADVLDGYPQKGVAYIGLLQIKASEHGKGYARLLHHELRRMVPGRERWRLSVVDTNEQAVPFWRALGYELTGETKEWQDADGGVHRVILMESRDEKLQADSQEKPNLRKA